MECVFGYNTVEFVKIDTDTYKWKDVLLVCHTDGTTHMWQARVDLGTLCTLSTPEYHTANEALADLWEQVREIHRVTLRITRRVRPWRCKPTDFRMGD